MREVDLWKRVLNDTRLLERAAGADPADVSAVAALRKQYDRDAVAVALELGAARRKAIRKLGERGSTLAADLAGVEQASGGAVAAYKARRIAQVAGAQPVADLCCGIGGDSMALVDAGLEVHAVDRDPLRAWMTQHNTNSGADTVCADVEQLNTGDAIIHIDPARRDESTRRRAWRIDDYQPGPEVIARLIDHAQAAAVKLSPGIDTEALPRPGELEFISDQGRLVQAVLWTGALAGDARRATLLKGDNTQVLSGEPLAPPTGVVQRHLYTFDAAVERAGLIGQLCEQAGVPAVHPRLGLLTSDRILDSPWLTGFELIERLPWRPRRVRQWLAANDGGIIEIKTRGKACDPDREQTNLRGDGATAYTVFVLRFDTKVEALICKRL